MPLEDARAEVADLLFELGAIKFGAFKLKLHEKHPDAPPSPIYLNLRTADHPKNPGPLTSEVMGLIGELFADEVREKPIRIDFICGIPDAGEPFVEQILRHFSLVSRILLTKDVHDDGTREVVPLMNYPVFWHEPCLVVDDLITKADSKLEAIKALESLNLTVRDVLVLVDRQQGGKEQLEKADYRLYSIFTLDELLRHYVSKRFITKARAKEVRYYIASNR